MIAAEEKRQPETKSSIVSLPRILDPADPLATARRCVAEEFMCDGARVLHYYRGEFFRWSNGVYVVFPEPELRAEVYSYCEVSQAQQKDGSTKAFRPTARKVNDILDALRALAQLSESIETPAWLEEVAPLPPSDLIPCTNGLLHLPELLVLGHIPTYFNLASLPVAFDPDAPNPLEWLRFLESLWGDDLEAIACLQEIFGYLLTTDTRQQKIFAIFGPKRSGKGTIARVLIKLLGQHNVVSPTLRSLGQQFGVAPLIHKPLAIVADARLGARNDSAEILERLLNISGEDAMTIDRKYRDPWTGKLPTRFLLLSNELPRIPDTSGALSGRFVLLTLTRSFYGKEDIELTEKLSSELPGILRWSLDGLYRMRQRGRFNLPQSSQDVVQELEDLGSPVGAFVRDCCVIGPGREVQVKTMFEAWTDWCKDQGRDQPGTAAVFGRNLRAAVPGIKTRGRRPFSQYLGISRR